MTRKEQVLNWVNRVRGTYDKKPLTRLPKGTCNSPTACTIAEALKTCCDAEVVIYGDTGRIDGEPLKMPKYVESFINGFDAGRYPELVKT